MAAPLVRAEGDDRWDMADAGNPILPGYFADPTVIEYEGRHYLYATIEPWGGRTLGCWVTSDFAEWTYHPLNWPTKEACTSPTSLEANVWAPSVVRGRDGRFHMYVSVGSEIWTGVADHPLGPWKNALGDRPLVTADFDRRYHMIDADAFVDEDGSAYLYWGSGWNWVNGACFAVRLGADLASFEGEPRVVTPTNYFEGPTLLKHDGRYYLTYSQGRTVSDTYEVRYAVGDTPLGPFVEGNNSPILTTDHARHVVSPGHHGFLRREGQVYIVYHRHRIPYVAGSAFRQVCVDPLRFGEDGTIATVMPTHRAPAFMRRTEAERARALFAASGVRLEASSAADAHTGANAAFDNNYATRWVASEPGEGWLQVDFGRVRDLQGSRILPEYPNEAYRAWIEVSEDGERWSEAWRNVPESPGSPLVAVHAVPARYVRLRMNSVGPRAAGVFEWRLE